MAPLLSIAAALAIPAVAMAAAIAQLPEGDSRIVGGVEAGDGDFPSLVHFTVSGTKQCGGALINAKTVLTAAHCIHAYDTDVIVRAGSNLWNSGGIQVGVEKIILHPEYAPQPRHDNDFAILHLNASIRASSKIGYAKIEQKGSDVTAGTNVTVAGWGQLKHKGEHVDKLRKTMVKVVSRQECKALYAKTSHTITENMICAKDEGKDACGGDSGGPLFITGTNTVVGVVSWGIGCANSSYAGVYSRVGVMVDFLLANLAPGSDKPIQVPGQSPAPSSSQPPVQTPTPSPSPPPVQSPAPSSNRPPVQSPLPSASRPPVQSPLPSASRPPVQTLTPMPTPSQNPEQAPIPVSKPPSQTKVCRPRKHRRRS
ncbi:hypothetical protein LOZ39_000979 [Ophidiomyces ophidiicola]|nr:uncharacterized protein LOZ57_006024 [Ophidiomyces ophidiicola]KAI1911763.1 hypothetical protein LOZ61_003635 [Ophidiomyces ophidiicola]KAI1939741.1 hypothetical protein LOZ57_006024 [Ophidiomyces ophidiicola]KAI2035186.1 hypothetical protein LOZ48_001359 [Ophidiomyces ophidiicola]KAI2079674.1 hypothetical protein LOZ39_000979 [Ophidiomyces ophidiicola]KAI2141131.1 hypothetical protein LOZ27_004620 [Ophidiomyces ophidiicola]